MFSQLKELTLLYIEDIKSIREEYLKTFELLFKDSYSASNFEEALILYNSIKPDILIIDIELKMSKNGFDIANKIRKVDLDTPIIFLTAHSESTIILKAINNNINGFIVKPLNLPKLIEVTKKCVFQKKKSYLIKISNKLTYNFNTHELKEENKLISLGKKENKLLFFLLKNKNKTLRREEIEYEIWNESFISYSALKNIISVLRKKIGKDKITNISGIGWRINID